MSAGARPAAAIFEHLLRGIGGWIETISEPVLVIIVVELELPSKYLDHYLAVFLLC